MFILKIFSFGRIVCSRQRASTSEDKVRVFYAIKLVFTQINISKHYYGPKVLDICAKNNFKSHDQAVTQPRAYLVLAAGGCVQTHDHLDLRQVFVFLILPNLTYMESL